MRFILDLSRIALLLDLNADYHQRKEIDPSSSQAYYGLFNCIGVTDLITRRAQILFLKRMISMHLPQNKDDSMNLKYCRIALAACLYIQSQLNNCTLYQLINDKLNINEYNFLDDEDQLRCLESAKEVFAKTTAFEKLNSNLGQDNSISREEYERFLNFLVKRSSELQQNKTLNTRPITSLIQPLFSTSFFYVGSAAGWVLADVISPSAATISTKAQIASLLGGALLGFNLAGPIAVAFIAPPIAARLISYFCVVSLASVSGTSMAYLGHGAGYVCGLPLDMTLNLLKTTGKYVINYCSTSHDLKPIDGLRIADGLKIRIDSHIIECHDSKEDKINDLCSQQTCSL